MTTKREILREKILATRDQLTLTQRSKKSKIITENLWHLDKFHQAGTLFIYINFRSEVETMSLIKQCLAKNKRVAVPLTLPAEHRLTAYLINNLTQELHPGYCGILEPDPKQLTLLNPQEIDTVILPGTVFDQRGGRLGYGGGYYDRFLANEAKKAIRVGIGFGLQLATDLPLLAHDQRLHYLITETQIVKCEP